MKGRKKIPNAVKALRGTEQPCRATPEVPMSAVTTLPNSRLKGTATELIHKNLLEVVNLDLVISYAREMALYHDTMRELEREGMTIEVETKYGSMTYINPKRKVAESALANAKMLACEFGFTPASRSRVSALLAPKEKKDDFADFEEV